MNRDIATDPFRNPGLVKICGLRDPSHARAAVAAGADLLGFIFAPARRQVTTETACTCIVAARAEAEERRVLAVGVFVDAPAAAMNAAAERAGLDLLQLHGDEPPSLLAELNRPVIKVLRPPAGSPPDAVERQIDRYREVANAPLAFLIEGYAAAAAGGEGVRADWHLAARLAQRCRLILAGGLAPDNVATAIATAQPLAVDVSSGVETDGCKDATKIAAFVLAAKRAFGVGC